jgi:subfamily B ATP-binding cassette protein MsbA
MIEPAGNSFDTAAGDWPVLSWRDYLPQLLNYFRPYRWHLLAAVIATLLVSGSSVVALMLVERVSQALLNAGDLAVLNQILLSVVVVFAVVGVIAFAQIYLSGYAGHRVASSMRRDALEHLLNLSLAFHQRQRVGELMMRVNQDIQVIQQAVDRLVTRVLRIVFMPLIVLLYLVYLNWRLTLLSVVIVPLFAGVFLWIGKKLYRSGHQAATGLAGLNAALQEILLNNYIIKCFASEAHELERFEQRNRRYLQINLRQLRLLALQRPLMALLQMCCVLAIVWYGAAQLHNGMLNVSQLTAFFAGLGVLISTFSALSGLHLEIQNVVVAVERFFQLLAVPPTLIDAPDAIELPRPRGAVAFEQVGFRYSEDAGAPLVLRDISFTALPGQTVALVGLSGAGKTTLMNLLLRLYDPLSGRITIDGYDLRRLTMASLRRYIAIVPQQPELFSGTLRDNIAYGNREACDAAIIAAAQQAHAHDFISRLPGAYAATTGERGVRLSAGERQRIAIARAFLRDPRIIILDEPSAFLDAHSEHLIQQSLQSLALGRTTFVIAHRFSTLLSADSIVVLEQGRIVESGNHDTLLSRRGRYAGLYRRQVDGLLIDR